jgi:hypothetical protein
MDPFTLTRFTSKGASRDAIALLVAAGVVSQELALQQWPHDIHALTDELLRPSG